MIRLIAALSVILLVAFSAAAQDTLWTKTFGWPASAEQIWTLEPTSDGYIAVGRTDRDGDPDLWLVKLNHYFDTVWTRTFGTAGEPDYGLCAKQTIDGGYIAVGASSNNLGYVVKTDYAGNLEWERTPVIADQFCYIRWVEPLDDNSYIIAGHEVTFAPDANNAFVMRLDSLGYEYVSSSPPYFWTRWWADRRVYQFQITGDTGLVACGWASTPGTADTTDAWLVQIDTTLSDVWSYTYGSPSQRDGFRSLHLNTDGSIVAVGFTGSWETSDQDLYLLKVDASGGYDWSTTVDGGDNNEGYKLGRTWDGGYVVSGYNHGGEFGSVDADCWAVKFDGAGDTLWSVTFGSPYTDWLVSVPVEDTAGEYLLAGQLEGESETDLSDGLVARISDRSPCAWHPGEPHKMHDAQLPNESGWAVNSTSPLVLADDFQCRETGWIKDVHFWGGWMGGVEGNITGFHLSLYADITAEQSPTGYSIPGELLWQKEITSFDATPIYALTFEGWHDPTAQIYEENDHAAYYQYDVCLDSPDWFAQDSGTIYWLAVKANVENSGQVRWGWKSSVNRWNDDAVWAYDGDWSWIDMYEPGFTYVPGDVDDDGDVDEADWGYLYDYLFESGPPPPYEEDGFYPAADADGDCDVDSNDWIYLEIYLHYAGPTPTFCPQNPPAPILTSLNLAFVITGDSSGQQSCCLGSIRGNVDYDGGDAIDISDLVYLVDYMFTGGAAPACAEEANIDASCCVNPPEESLSDIDISDLVYLVDYMFNGGPPPPACP